MARNGSGTFTRLYSWIADAANGLKISSSRMDADSDDIALALTQSLAKDGQTVPTANLPMGGFKHTGALAGSATGDYATYEQLQAAGASGIAQVVGVVGANNAATPNTKIDFTSADVVVLKSASALSVTRTAIASLTCDTGTMAANGRDQAGAFGNSSWVHFYYIYGSVPGNACIASASATAPTLPATYTHYAFICSLRKQAGGTFQPVHIQGDRVNYDATEDVLENQVLTSGAATSVTSFSLATAVPTTAKGYAIHYVLGGRANNADSFSLRVASAGSVTFSNTTPSIAGSPFVAGVTQEFTNQQTLYYRVTNASDTLDLWVTGFRVKNGG